MKNPSAALAAVNAPLTIRIGPYEVRDITLGLAAVLEAIESPVVTGSRPADLSGWAPTLYAMTHPVADSRRLLTASGVEGYVAAALQWSDDLPLALGRELIEAVTAAINRIKGISAEDDAGEGNSPGNPTAAGPTAG